MTGVATLMLLVACGGGGGGGGAQSLEPREQKARVSGTITGLAENNTITMQLNDGEPQTFAYQGLERAYVFRETFPRGEAYSVRIVRQPLNQLCEVRNASGIADAADANISNVDVFCFDTLLNDTGVLQAPDGDDGRDPAAEAGILARVGNGRLGFDFTAICASGSAAGASGCPATPTVGTDPDQWACTRDNLTGLVWQIAPMAPAGNRDAAAQRVSAANDASRCGRTDWRLPSAMELSSIVDSGAAFDAPAIDDERFPTVSMERYWTATERVGDASVNWVVDFDSGAVAIPNQGENARALPVSGDVFGEIAADSFEIRDAAVFIDHRFGLMWLTTDQTGDWDAATDLASQVNADAPAGFSDWRLPNRNELASLVDRERNNAAIPASIDGSLQPPLRPEGYWSATAFSAAPDAADLAWRVDLDNGDVLPGMLDDQRRIVLVRNRFRGED